MPIKVVHMVSTKLNPKAIWNSQNGMISPTREVEVLRLNIHDQRRFEFRLGKLKFISWRTHGMNIVLPTLVRLGLVVPLDKPKMG